jgi:hypothetical protein
MIRGVVFSGLATLMLLGITLQAATPPRSDDPHASPGSSLETSSGCDEVVEYGELLFSMLSDHEEFAEYWSNGNPDDLQSEDVDDVQAIVDDGQALLDEMQEVVVPELYVSGHEGIMLLYGYDVNTAAFFGVDTSEVPDFDQWNRGLALILAGELSIAKACPDEVEEVGGYIFIPVDVLEDILGQP